MPCSSKAQKNSTSTPVVRTGVYPHMPIAVTTVVKDIFGSVFSNTRYKILCMYSCRIFYDSSRHRLRHRTSSRNTNRLVYNTGRDRPCSGLFLTRSATVGQVCHTELTPSNVLSIFRFLTLGAYPWVKGHQKGR